MPFEKPWTVEGEVLLWNAGAGPRIRFDPIGMAFEGGEPKHVAWAALRELDIRLPISSRFAARVEPVLSAISPTPYRYAPHGLDLWGRAGWSEFRWRSTRAQRCDWRLQFAIDELLDCVQRHPAGYSLLGQTSLWEALASDVAPVVAAASRMMLHADVPGLNARIGHGSLAERINRLIDQHA